MSTFTDELTTVSRTGEQILQDNVQIKQKKISDSMKISEEILKDFDEQFLSILKTNIKTRAYNGEFTKQEDGTNKLEGKFSYRLRYNFEGFSFPKGNNTQSKSHLDFELRLLVVEDDTKKRFILNSQGRRFYINEEILEHIKELVKNEGIEIVDVTGFPPIDEFISERHFIKKYSNISIDFKYQIIY